MKKIFALALTASALLVIAACSADNSLSMTSSNEGPTKDLLDDGIKGIGVSAPSSSSTGKSSSSSKAPSRSITDDYMDDECDDWEFDSVEGSYNVYYCYDDKSDYYCDEDECF